MELVRLVSALQKAIGLLAGALYFYQVIYLAVGLLSRRRPKACPVRLRRYAVLISARNEENVIGELIASLKRQNYPARLLDIYVVADNCTDATAAVARRAGAMVYPRFDRVEVGKGYALDFLLKKLMVDGLFDRYAGFFVFDADNIVDPSFVSEMNRTFDKGGFAAITGYRNSKNFGENWITAGYSLWFLREARLVNAARMALGLSCHVSGTGFLVAADVIREKGGWPYHLLTEDLQFSAECAAEGRRIGYCADAIIYDEQPTSFRQSWDQRLRWSRGFFQVGGRYAPSLFRGMAHGGRKGFVCYDILLTVTPGVLLTLAGAILQGMVALSCFSAPVYIIYAILNLTGSWLWHGLVGFYFGMLAYGAITLASEWGRIRATTWQKIGYLFTTPIFMLTYIPVTVCAIFQKVEWKPIAHKSLARIDPAA